MVYLFFFLSFFFIFFFLILFSFRIKHGCRLTSTIKSLVGFQLNTQPKLLSFYLFPILFLFMTMSSKSGNLNPKSTSSNMHESGSELRRGPWTLEEDNLLIHHISCHGEGRWNSLAKFAGIFTQLHMHVCVCVRIAYILWIPFRIVFLFPGFVEYLKLLTLFFSKK